MLTKPLLSHILRNEALTRGLADPEARILVEWLVERADHLASGAAPDTDLSQQVTRLCRRGRAVGRFVGLWCHQQEWGAAMQLAAVEHFTWPLPYMAMDPCELMQSILAHEATTT